MRIAARQALIDQHSCFILATNELDDTLLSPQELLAGYKGQAQAERGFRFLKDPQFLASSLYLKKPERIMALLMVMTVCLLVYAALEYRIRQALKEHEATFPDQKGKRIQNPTARWVFHYFVGIHLLYLPQQWPIVINLTEEHQHLLQLLGNRYAWFYQMNIHQNQCLSAECRLNTNVFVTMALLLTWWPKFCPKYCIKRVIGLPDDKVEIKEKTILINDLEFFDKHANFMDKKSSVPQRDNLGPSTTT